MDINKLMSEIFEQREEILRAFIAKYGFEPDECEQTIVRDHHYKIIWSVQKKDKE
jgi:hypothetical protein